MSFFKNFKFEITNVKFIIIFTTFIYITHNAIIIDKFTKWFMINDSFDYTGFIALSIVGLLLSISLFTILAHRYIIKGFAIFIIITSAASSYFILKYGIAIDRSMVMNVWFTDQAEASELLSIDMIPHLVFLILLPIFIVLRTKIIFDKPLTHIVRLVAVFIITVTLSVAFMYLKFTSIQNAVNKSHKYIGYQLIPINFLINISRVIVKEVKSNINIEPEEFKIDGKVLSNDDLIVVLAVGETSRQKNFTLYGYKGNKTDPRLSKYDDLYALNGIAKYGSTIFAIPNILSRDDIKLASISSHLGIKTTCFSNYKLYGNCGIVEEVMVSNCKYGKCYDEDVIPLLKKDLDTYESGKKMVVLHLGAGSHGPLYYKKHPDEFRKFQPMCMDADVINKCTKEELYNAFDNTILYVDYVVSEVIETLEAKNKPYVFIFMSDHGESLLENGRIFHGMPPGMKLPDEQAQVPLFVKSNVPIKVSKRDQYKQQDVYDTVLDLLSIEVDILKKDKVFINVEDK